MKRRPPAPVVRPILARELHRIAERLERRAAYWDGLGQYDTASELRQTGNELRCELDSLGMRPSHKGTCP